MKKVKWIIIGMAIVFSIGAAFTTRSHFDCRFSPQFYQVGSSYVPAGQEGVDYICQSGPAVCTFVQVGSNWAACQIGIMTR